MYAAYANDVNSNDPLSALVLGQRPTPEPRDGWINVSVSAAALNHHDLWSLSGVGLTAKQCPMILGCDAAGIDAEGNEVVVHAVVGDSAAGGGDETLDPGRSLLSEQYDGTLAQLVSVPRRNLIAKPPQLSFAEAACLPTSYLTAYRMLATKGRLAADNAVLIQGAGGGVSSAAILLANAMGARVYVTGRDAARRELAATLGATALPTGERLPERVDVVIESVGSATFEHSMKCAKPGARIVVCGATSGHIASVDLRRLFFLQLEILGSTMGTIDELAALVELCHRESVRPIIDSTYRLSAAAAAFERLRDGEAFGKIVIEP